MSTSFPKSKIKALLLENIDKGAVEAFEKEGYQVEALTKSLGEEELLEKLSQIHILGIRSKTQLTKRVLKAAPKLLSIGAFCIGTDQIDLEQAALAGLAVFNAPYSNTRSVVELALGEIIMLLRGTFDKSSKLHQGIWDKSALGNVEIRGKKLGIVGYGKIGSQLGDVAERMGMEVYFYNTSETLARGNAKKTNNLQEILKIADIVTVHVSGDIKNTNLFSAKQFNLMKDGAIFLNLSRGFVVNLDDLAKALKKGKLRGAAIDVFPSEPKSNEEKFTSPLQNLPNVILTPHIGGSTEEAQKDIGQFVSGKIIEFINTGNTLLSVNLPNIQLPDQKDAHRFLHLHKNVPGIMAQINNILAKHNINILGQYLKTNETVGYVITDVNKEYNQQVIEELKQVPDTLKFRVLY